MNLVWTIMIFKEKADCEAALAAAIIADTKENILEKVKHLQNQVAYAKMASLVATHVMKEMRGNEKLLKAHIHELEKQGK